MSSSNTTTRNEPATHEHRWLTQKSAAQALGVHRNTLRRWALDGYIQTKMRGPRMVYDITSLNQEAA